MLAIFFLKLNFLKVLSEISTKCLAVLDTEEVPPFVWSDLGPKCVQRFNISRFQMSC